MVLKWPCHTFVTFELRQIILGLENVLTTRSKYLVRKLKQQFRDGRGSLTRTQNDKHISLFI